MGAYQDYIDALSPDHYWRLDGNSTNTGVTTLTVQTPSGYLSGSPITAGATNSCLFNGTNDLDYGDSSLNLGGPWLRRSYSMWGTFSDPNRDSLCYNEGAGVRNMSLYFSLGGVPAYIVDNDADSGAGQPWSQAIFGSALEQDVPYHMGMVWESDVSGGYSYVRAYLNGALIQEKEIRSNDGSLPGGQLNAHSGNIELGTGQQIIVSGQTFNVSTHVGLLADVAVWDDVLLDDSQMSDLYTLAALPAANRTAVFTDVPVGTEIRLFELDSLGGTVITEFDGVESSSGGTETLLYTCAVDVPARVAIVSVTGQQIFYTDTVLTRSGASFPVDLLLDIERNYENA